MDYSGTFVIEICFVGQCSEYEAFLLVFQFIIISLQNDNVFKILSNHIIVIIYKLYILLSFYVDAHIIGIV